MDLVPSHVRSQSANRVKSKAPAKVQITAEQLLREAWERKERAVPVPKQQIADSEELLDYQRTERKQYEMRIVRNRSHTPLWIRYARWEEEQSEFVRARSIWERAIDNDYRNPVIWLNYAEMEMRHRFINHARNVFDRAVALLPRVDQIWLKYAHMEEMLGQLNLARLVYQRWMKWFPENSAYFAFIRFELRHGRGDNARKVYEQLVNVHPTSHSYVKYAKFEERQEEYARARHIFERATGALSTTQLAPPFFLSFAKFEERRKQMNRARAIYQFATKHFSESESPELHQSFASFEKRHGERETLDSLLSSKKRNSYEAILHENSTDYDTWFDLIQLEESTSSADRIREVYERAVSNAPPVATKPSWSRYVYLWISYAVWEELACEDLQAAIKVYKRCIDRMPKKHRKFSFGKLWMYYAQAEVRNKNIPAARKILGTGLGVLPGKHSLYEKYIELEISLGEFDRVRKIYENWLTRNPTYEPAFLALAELELSLGETHRARSVLEMATSIEELASSTNLWEKLADVLKSEDESSAVRRFEGYINSKPRLAVWLAYIKMMEDLHAANEAIRRVYERSVNALREEAIAEKGNSEQLREEAYDMANRWIYWEENYPDDSNDKEICVARAKRLLPRRVKKVRKGVEGDEEYWQIVFREEETSVEGVGNKLLEAAKRWKREQSRDES